jgi:hypothetical protein
MPGHSEEDSFRPASKCFPSVIEEILFGKFESVQPGTWEDDQVDIMLTIHGDQ